MTGGLCVAPEVRVRIPETTLSVGPSDWEADKLVQPRTIHVKAFDIDAFELTVHDLTPGTEDDPARAQGELDRAAVQAVCARRGGRLPTEDEWIVAASTRGTRYPWGDTGAVCRRAAWGLTSGPCTHGARLPDTVGAHGDGDTVTGLHDLAGNVAEWVDAPGHEGVVMGGSFRTELASELRVWARRVVAPGIHDPTIGGRCAYDLR